ncbi:MAG: hypothetical protein ACK40S_07335 [Burkholderiaceae bacterium]
MSKHTPGPWGHIIADGYTVRHPQIYSDTGPVANATFLGENHVDQLNANARLIAAAPELLKALQMLLEFPNTGPATSAARIAIAKATGESK